jgi:hypothetical protein
MGYSPPKGRSPTCYSPVRHSHEAPKDLTPVRLACLIRAASVRSEPGSNSPSYVVAPHSEEQRAHYYSLILFSSRDPHCSSLTLSILTSLSLPYPKNTLRHPGSSQRARCSCSHFKEPAFPPILQSTAHCAFVLLEADSGAQGGIYCGL